MVSDVDLLPLLFFGLTDSYERLRSRLTGLSDDEYLWEPVSGMWSVREVDTQWLVEDGPEAEVPSPVTTIAWRMWHIASSCLAGYVTHLGPWPLELEGTEWYPDAASAVAALELSWTVFHERVHALGEAGLRAALGPGWGPFAENSWAELVVHAADELAHHGAEIALLRDLYPLMTTGYQPVR
jgi:hypothetical protein